MSIAKIQDLNVDVNAKLNADTKKALVNIIYEEFNRQSTIYNAQAEEQETKLMDQYRKGVGFSKLRSDLDKAQETVKTAQNKVEEAKKKIMLKGLDEQGNKISWYGGLRSNSTTEEKEQYASVKKIEKLLDAVKSFGPENIKNKVISRLWLANTNGEAMVILREVLGNGIIPTLSQSEVKAITMQ